MNLRTQKIRMYRSVMAQKIRTNPEAKDIENRYRLIRSVLKEVYPNLIESTSKETMIEFLRDAIFLDREARLHNEGNQKELKDQLMQEKLAELHS